MLIFIRLFIIWTFLCLYTPINSHVLQENNFCITKIIVALQNNTHCLRKLYDIYLCVSINDDNYLDFKKALSKVGEVLSSRFILEDQ
ncbi:MAG: hypothetical protein V6009_01895 [Candidatus Dasytiphilus stammeri]